MLLSIKAEYGVILSEHLSGEALEDWQQVYLGTNLVELFLAKQTQKYLLAIDVAQIGQVHNRVVIEQLRAKQHW